MYVANNSVVFIFPATVKSVLTTKPLFGEIIAVAEPDFNLSKSPRAVALILNNPLPSPLNKDADIDDEILAEPLICVFAFICNGLVPNESISSVCILEAVKFPTTFTDSDEAFNIDAPLTKSDTLFTLV
jgi:hypothetical protein